MFNYLKYRLSEILYGGKKIEIPKDALVLEVASGNKPYWRSNILLDKFILDSSERSRDYVVIDRDFIAGDAIHLPFKDKAFDFVIARHILEHLYEPEIFLKELQRVAMAGYIETPSSFSEELYGWPYHLWKIDIENGRLILTGRDKKINTNLKKLSTHFDNDNNLKNFARRNRDLFYTCYQWNDVIDYKIVNASSFVKEIESQNRESDAGFSLKTYKKRYSFKTRVKIFLDSVRREFVCGRLRYDLINLLQCAKCGGPMKKSSEEKPYIFCKQCDSKFPYKDTIVFTI